MRRVGLMTQRKLRGGRNKREQSKNKIKVQNCRDNEE